MTNVCTCQRQCALEVVAALPRLECKPRKPCGDVVFVCIGAKDGAAYMKQIPSVTIAFVRCVHCLIGIAIETSEGDADVPRCDVRLDVSMHKPWCGKDLQPRYTMNDVKGQHKTHERQRGKLKQRG
jgi:hypothetical protein